MNARQIGILKTGLVTAVGLDAPSSCAAFRAKVTNPTETRFLDSSGEWIMAHQVILDQPWSGLSKLAKMAAMAIDEALVDIPTEDWQKIPLLLCVAETERPGRLKGMDDQLLSMVEAELNAVFSPHSLVFPDGRVSVANALAKARILLQQETIPHVLIAATDSLLCSATLSYYDRIDRLLTTKNSNGFIPGEGAGASLVGYPTNRTRLLCNGIGFGMEHAHVESEEPLRADGLTTAFKAALDDAGMLMHELDFRITDISGEHYHFKEASLALSRTLRHLKESFYLWHMADCVGETGATSGLIALACAKAAGERNYAPGVGAMLHFNRDDGHRAAIVAVFR